MLRDLFRIKPLVLAHQETSLRRSLGAFDLILLGIGAIIGAGVFVITGIAAATKGGPAITISYVVAGIASLFAALAYAELASSIGGCGSAYAYAYAGFGEFIAWLIGWNLILEYAMSVATVAIGWSGYVNNLLQTLNIHIPDALQKNPFEGGVINFLAFGIVILLSILLSIGTKQSARFNACIVFIKLATVAMFIIVASQHVNPANWSNFAPFGWTGIMQGAALVFFAYIGFDALSTAAEETVNPQRNLPIGIIGSLIICTFIYIIVSALLTGIVPYDTLNVQSPVSDALLRLGFPIAAGIIAAGAIAGLTTVMLVMYYGFTRVCFAISRDGLLPKFFSNINHRTHTPISLIMLSGIVIALIAGFTPIDRVAELVNIGTLTAFAFVCGGIVILRWTKPEMHRPFKTPWSPVLPILGVLTCLYLMLNLPSITWWRFVIWTIIGIIIYFTYSRQKSLLNIKNNSQPK